ncbi:hypothetical protein Psch_00831 [Pelotomaculum schinkii]|uniref:Uncharacterized protein n=1 Tax=Pelotomaculum schinkii TaxID=78350 RepID=A0A4Y7RE70_9FIRM|nr:hypothetical protein Psch_00831 [Pelotomaculum schinkii]
MGCYMICKNFLSGSEPCISVSELLGFAKPSYPMIGQRDLTRLGSLSLLMMLAVDAVYGKAAWSTATGSRGAVRPSKAT